MSKLVIEKENEKNVYFKGWGSPTGLWTEWQTCAYSFNLSDVDKAYETKAFLKEQGFDCVVREI
jgi:hypothetical protein